MDDSDLVHGEGQICSDTDFDTAEEPEKDDELVDEERESCPLRVALSKPPRKPFSDKQVTCLCDHYKRGMIGIGNKYSALIDAASKESGLTIKQVKVSELHVDTLFCIYMFVKKGHH